MKFFLHFDAKKIFPAIGIPSMGVILSIQFFYILGEIGSIKTFDIIKRGGKLTAEL